MSWGNCSIRSIAACACRKREAQKNENEKNLHNKSSRSLISPPCAFTYHNISANN